MFGLNVDSILSPTSGTCVVSPIPFPFFTSKGFTKSITFSSNNSLPASSIPRSLNFNFLLRSKVDIIFGAKGEFLKPFKPTANPVKTSPKIAPPKAFLSLASIGDISSSALNTDAGIFNTSITGSNAPSYSSTML